MLDVDKLLSAFIIIKQLSTISYYFFYAFQTYGQLQAGYYLMRIYNCLV